MSGQIRPKLSIGAESCDIFVGIKLVGDVLLLEDQAESKLNVFNPSGDSGSGKAASLDGDVSANQLDNYFT